MEELWRCGLTKSVSIVCDIELHCLSEKTTPTFVTMVRLADSLSEQQRYFEAIDHYRRAVKQMKELKEAGQSFGKVSDDVEESEVRVRMATCQYKMKQYMCALETLEPVVYNSKGECSVKATALCAATHKKLGQSKKAVNCYMDVLRQCPLALEAINGLLHAGVKSAEILSLIPSEILSRYCWLSVWIEAREQIEICHYTGAITLLQSLVDKAIESSELLAELAYSQWMAGQLDDARKTFYRARCFNALIVTHMDSYAHLLFIDKNEMELQKLSTSLQENCPQHCESWIALSYLSYLMDKKSRALSFSQKAYTINDSNVEAIVVSGFILQKLNKAQDALFHYREAVRRSPGHFYANEGLVLCLLQCQQKPSAEVIAQTFLKKTGHTARGHMLLGIAISNDEENRKRKRQVLMKAISLDASLSQAHLLLVESFRETLEYDRAIKILEAGLSQVDAGQAMTLCVALADMLQLAGRPQEALEHYDTVLRLDPSCYDALVGQQEVQAMITAQDPSINFTNEYEFDSQTTHNET